MRHLVRERALQVIRMARDHDPLMGGGPEPLRVGCSLGAESIEAGTLLDPHLEVIEVTVGEEVEDLGPELRHEILHARCLDLARGADPTAIERAHVAGGVAMRRRSTPATPARREGPGRRLRAWLTGNRTPLHHDTKTSARRVPAGDTARATVRASPGKCLDGSLRDELDPGSRPYRRSLRRVGGERDRSAGSAIEPRANPSDDRSTGTR